MLPMLLIACVQVNHARGMATGDDKTRLWHKVQPSRQSDTGAE